MMERFQELLDNNGGYYHVDDILENIKQGVMQSFTDGNSWVITQVHDFPRKRVVEIVYAIGDMEVLSKELLEQVETFARSVSANDVIASGRPGWEKVMADGWDKLSVNYVRRL